MAEPEPNIAIKIPADDRAAVNFFINYLNDIIRMVIDKKNMDVSGELFLVSLIVRSYCLYRVLRNVIHEPLSMRSL